MIKLSKLKLNDRNPRIIKTEAFDRLKSSIQRDPEFMILRPIVTDEVGLILGGNMRFRACQGLGMKELPDGWVVKATDLSEEQKRRFILVDNAPGGMAGDWDFDILSADWDVPELEELGFQFPSGWGETSDIIEDQSDAKSGLTENECPKCGFKWNSNE